MAPPTYVLPTARQEAYLRTHPPGKAVLFALRELFERDNRLLHINAKGRSIIFRFALQLQSQLIEWQVDCEFNRDGVEPNQLSHLGLYPGSDEEEAKTVFPDVIVHRRGANDNFLVLEFKKISE